MTPAHPNSDDSGTRGRATYGSSRWLDDDERANVSEREDDTDVPVDREAEDPMSANPTDDGTSERPRISSGSVWTSPEPAQADAPDGVGVADEPAPTPHGTGDPGTKAPDVPWDRHARAERGRLERPPAAADARGRGSRRGVGLAVLFLLLAFAAGVAGALFSDEVGGLIGIETEQPGDTGPRVADDADSGVRGAPLSDDPNALSVQEIYDRAAPAVVNITARQTVSGESIFGFPQEREGFSSGSGFVIDEEGNIVTNAHVVREASAITVTFSDNREVDAELVGLDISTDTAVIRVDVEADALSPLEFADSTATNVGDPVVAIGNPFGLDRTATTGIVSAIQREIRAENGFSIPDVIQTDAAINSGNSGGPLLDARGRVIGINSQIQTPSGGNVGIAFAIPSNTVRSVVEDLLEDGKVQHAWLGVVGVSIDDIALEYLRLPVEEGVLVSTVVADSPADKAGLRGAETFATRAGNEYPLDGDIIVQFDGTEIDSMRQLADMVAEREPGDRIEVVFYRGGDREEATVRLDERPDGLRD